MNKIIIIIFLLQLHLSSDAQFYLQNGSKIYLQSGANINLQNIDFVNDGLISALPGSKITFSGNSDNGISGATVTDFSQLEIAKTGTAKLSLQKDIGIYASVNFTSGNIDLNGKNILLQPAALLQGEQENSRIIGPAGGYVQIIIPLNAPAATDPGNLGATITSNQNLGNTIIKRGHVSQTGRLGSGNSILRYYEITPANNLNLDVTISFHYLDAELNGLAESNLVLWQSPNGTIWTNMNFALRDAGTNLLVKNSIQSLSRFTLSTNENVLPLNFIAFSDKCVNGSDVLSWETANGQNVEKLILERSSDGIIWQSLAELSPGIDPSLQQNYNYTSQANSTAKLYRIATIDVDGRLQYSPIIKSSCILENRNQITLFPNPTKGLVSIQVQTDKEEMAPVKLLNAVGQVLLVSNIKLIKGINNIPLNLTQYPAGIYVVSIMDKWINVIKE